MRLDPKDRNMAFVVVDVQKKYRMNHLDDELEHGFRVSRINSIARMFREAGRPVVFVRFVGENSLHRKYEGEDGDGFFEGIETEPGDLMVEKDHMNAFRGTGLEVRLRELGCDSILLAGTVTEFCVLSTYFGAYDNDLTPFMAESATISSSEENNLAVERITNTLAPDDIARYLRGEPFVKSVSLHPGPSDEIHTEQK